MCEKTKQRKIHNMNKSMSQIIIIIIIIMSQFLLRKIKNPQMRRLA